HVAQAVSGERHGQAVRVQGVSLFRGAALGQGSAEGRVPRREAMTVLSRRGAGAVLALGAAAWLSTFVFDRVGTGAGTRVALVSSWQEGIGLTVLAFLVVLLGKAIVERGVERAGGEKAI